MKLKMHIQKKTKTILRRVSALLFALVICATLAVSAFALNGVSPTNGYFTIKNQVTGNVSTFALPSSPPVDGNANYVSFIACNPYVGDQYPPVVFYITFANANWGINMVQTIVETSPTSYYSAYRISFTSSSVISSIYTATWHDFSLENALVAPSWVSQSLSSSIEYLDIYAFVASSKDVTSQGIVLYKKNSYANGVNGFMSGGTLVDGNFSYTDGAGNYYPIVPNLPNNPPTIADGDGYGLFFGFVDGMWSGLWRGYEILGNGLTIYGFSLHNAITTILVTLLVVGFVVFLVKVVFSK